ncbi:exocyst complex component Sec5-domain-containing protein [Delphinella strobiligena]|nr:exocyst complex component Sec5-domain-containing protein [Delphinella strobiligena]
MAAEVERELLNHYKLDSLFPAEWPQRDDESDTDDNETLAPADSSRSRYAGLDRRASLRSNLSAQKGPGGTDSHVQKDEPDPLGIAPSVVQQLRRRGLPVEENIRLRNRFLLSSTTFSPSLFLSQVHQDASTESLLRGLDFLSQSIEKKSASLKILVESNFERFVKAKATIDNVYQEMRHQGQDPVVPQSPGLGMAVNSRQASRNNAHFRTVSGSMNTLKATTTDKRKNALTKESEYGVLGIKAPLIELAVKAEEVWGPALGGRDKEEELKTVLSYVEQNRKVFCIAGNLQDAIKTRDYATLVEDYNLAKRQADQARDLADNASSGGMELTDAQVHQILVAGKIWHDTQNQLKTFKRDLWSELASGQIYRDPQNGEDQHDSHMVLIGTLLQLGVGENPIWFYLNSRSNQLKERLNNTFDRMRIEVEVARRKLASDTETSMQMRKLHLQSASAHLGPDRRNNMDAPKVLEFWEKVLDALKGLLSIQGGLMGEIVDFWEITQSFISGKAQRDLPNAVFSSEAALQHLELADDEIARLRQSAAELVTNMRESIFSFFADAPIDDLSPLFSPVPATPLTPGATLTPMENTRKFSFDVSNLPAPSPKKGESWEKYAFWPPYANSLSGANYLSRVLILVGIAASEVGGLSLVYEDSRLYDLLKSLVIGVRERCVQAVCAAWNEDSEACKQIEDWTRNPDRRDLTNMPMHFMNYEEAILQSMQKIMYISEAVQRSSSNSVIAPPSSKLVQVVRHQFVSSMYKALSGTVENAERTKPRPGSLSGEDPDGVSSPAVTEVKNGASMAVVDSTDRSVRILLSLSNLSHLRKHTIPHLLSSFETSFSVSLTDEQKTLRDVLAQIDARLFQSYTTPIVNQLANVITEGINSPTWEPHRGVRPDNARPYVYDVLLALVLVHSEVSSTATTITGTILSYHLEQISSTFLTAFRSRSSYSLAALMQATLDVELVAQTLSNYTTEKASELQSQIYLVLDERTDGEARSRLQGELPEMRSILKRLRESTKGEFGCFKKERRGRSDNRPSSRGQPSGGGPPQ